MEFETGTQREGIGQLVGRDGLALDHLRPRLEILVPVVEHVVDHQPVHQGDGRGVGMRIEDLQIGVRRDVQYHLVGEGRSGEAQRQHGRRSERDDARTDGHDCPPR
jgi:hypothetical protein